MESNHDKYNANCPKCGIRLAKHKMVLLRKGNNGDSKNLTRLCKECYAEFLEIFNVEDVNVI